VAEKDKAAAAAEAVGALEAAGNAPSFDAGGGQSGVCVISTKAAGEISCTGDWSAGAGAPLVVCLHGFKDTDTIGKFAPSVVGAGCRVLAPHFPGHGGKTGGDDAKPAMEAEEAIAAKGGPVAVVRELLDWLGESKALLLGQDWGAVVAVLFAAKNASRVDGLLLENKMARGESEYWLQVPVPAVCAAGVPPQSTVH
jgi:pimeloyl-ACP methyl ester carboxylesterase